MFGKHFASMYEGSMIGAGSVAFAVMGYVISHQVPDKRVGSQVELNPKLLAFVLGDTEENVVKAIEFLCAPDVGSRTPDFDGRRLVKLGTFDYQVVNGAKYRAVRDQDARRSQNREAQRRHRQKTASKNGLPTPGKPLKGEVEHVRMLEGGATEEQLDKQTTAALPHDCQ